MEKKLFSISIWKCCKQSKLFEIVTKLMLRKKKNWFSIDLRRWIERVFLSRRSYRRWNKSSMQILLAGIQPFSYLTIIYIHIRIHFFPIFLYILFCFADLVNSGKSNTAWKWALDCFSTHLQFRSPTQFDKDPFKSIVHHSRGLSKNRFQIENVYNFIFITTKKNRKKWNRP